ncbi:hypothetical protein QJS66_04810 [Kocuria rhizophila]|nr:hypothetical protein QJS66_04810 [Kocuria rhizophila]
MRLTVATVALVACAAVFVVILVTKFGAGGVAHDRRPSPDHPLHAAIAHHYRAVDAEPRRTRTRWCAPCPPVCTRSSWSRRRKPVVRALTYAWYAASSSLEAVVVDTADCTRTEDIVRSWQSLEIPAPITVLASPYRGLGGPGDRPHPRIRRKPPAPCDR